MAWLIWAVEDLEGSGGDGSALVNHERAFVRGARS